MHKKIGLACIKTTEQVSKFKRQSWQHIFLSEKLTDIPKLLFKDFFSMDTVLLSMAGTYRYFIEFIPFMYYHGSICSTFFVHTFVCSRIQLLLNAVL